MNGKRAESENDEIVIESDRTQILSRNQNNLLDFMKNAKVSSKIYIEKNGLTLKIKLTV